jgi:FkbM family methyltransferase
VLNHMDESSSPSHGSSESVAPRTVRSRLEKVVRTAQVYFPRLSDAKYGLQRRVRRMRRMPFEADFALLRHLTPPAGRQALDVGANRGQSIDAIRLFAPTVPIVSFEPNPNLAAVLRVRYDGDPRVTVNSFGLASTTSRQPLYVPRYRRYVFDGLASFDRVDAESWLEDRLYGFDPRHLELDVLSCELRRLDDLELSPYFMKVDVQGYELDVIKGGLETIDRFGPLMLIEAPTAELVDLLGKRDYVPFAYTDGALRPYAPGQSNTLFLTPHWCERFGVPAR